MQNKDNLAILRNNVLASESSETALTTPEPQEDYIHAATSDNTRKAYQSDIRHFIQWGGKLPCAADEVIRYLHAFAEVLNVRTLSRRITALKNWHIYQNQPDPTANQLVIKTLTGIKNTHGQPKQKAPPLALEQLTKISQYLQQQNTWLSIRNNALLQVGFFGAFRRSELVAIRWEDIQFVKEGIEILIPKSKTDQGGEGQVCAIPFGHEQLCPVTALKSWQQLVKVNEGFVFQKSPKKTEAIKPNQVNQILKTVAVACQFPQADQYSSHSLRRGFATEASKKGAPFGAIMRQGRWRHEGTVLGYIDEGKKFENNAVSTLLDISE